MQFTIYRHLDLLQRRQMSSHTWVRLFHSNLPARLSFFFLVFLFSSGISISKKQIRADFALFALPTPLAARRININFYLCLAVDSLFLCFIFLVSRVLTLARRKYFKQTELLAAEEEQFCCVFPHYGKLSKSLFIPSCLLDWRFEQSYINSWCGAREEIIIIIRTLRSGGKVK